jgi:hypothetical protein
LTERQRIARDESQPVCPAPSEPASNRKTAAGSNSDDDANRTRRSF